MGTITDKRKDPMGAAIADYARTGKADRLRVFSSMFDEDEIPVEELFRTIDEMSGLEVTALNESRGLILDVGAGSGCHSLALQEAGKDVFAIDISELSVEVMRRRGVKKVEAVDFFDAQFDPKIDTILMLMNGAGIVGKVERLKDFFAKADSLLAPGGQIILDSSDLIYLYEDENGAVDIDLDGAYYGEVDFTMQYKNLKGNAFDWLYIDFGSLSFHAKENGFHAELLQHGEHYDYLARLTRI